MDILDELEESYEKELCREADMARIPFGGTFELLPLCNMRCRMCYIEQRQKEVEDRGGLLRKEFWLDIAGRAARQGMLYLLITGGEPFLYPGFMDLYRELKQMGLHIVINTNGTLLSEEIIQELEKNPPRRLNISLYGASADTYERLCGNGENYEKVVRNLERLKNSRVLVRLHTSLTPENIADYDGMARIANDLEMPLGVAYYMFPSVRRGDAELNKDFRFDACEAGRVKFRYTRDSSSKEEFEKLLHELPDCLANYQSYDYYGWEKISCRAGLSTFWVNWKGEMLPCGMMETPCVDLNQTEFESAWEEIKKQRDTVRICEECASCEKRRYCNVCAASIYGETGSYRRGKPEYLCQMTEEYIRLLREEREKRYGETV